MNRKLWPTASLLLNLILLGTVVLLLKPSTSGELKSEQVPVVASQNAAVANDQQLPPPNAPVASANVPDWQNWLTQLRSAGVPDNVLAGLVVSDFENRWEKQRRDLQRRCNRGEVDEATITRLVEQHDASQGEELKTALGAEGFLKWDKDRVLSDFDADKIQLSSSETDALYQLRKDLAQKESDLKQAHLNGELDQVDVDQQETAADVDYKEKLKSLLGDARYAALQKPEDGAQGELVRTLKTLNVSDAQFASMLAAQKQWNDQRDALDREFQDSKTQSHTYEDQMRAIDSARDAEYQRALGTNGFDALQKTQDANYQALQRYATAWQLSDSDIDYVYRTVQYSQTSVADYRQQAEALEGSGKTVDWPKVSANIKAFTQQTQQALHSYLGDDRFNKLEKNSVFEFAGE